MADIKTLLINKLTALFPTYPVYLQGTVSDDASMPDSFFTFFNNSTVDDAFYDNTEHCTIWDFDLNFYSTDPALVNTVLASVVAALKAEGWTIDGVGYDLISDIKTHTGRGVNALYMDR